MSTETSVTVADMPLLLTVEKAAERLGVGRTTLFRLIADGDVESVSVGRLRRVPAECLEEYVRRLRYEHAPLTATAA